MIFLRSILLVATLLGSISMFALFIRLILSAKEKSKRSALVDDVGDWQVAVASKGKGKGKIQTGTPNILGSAVQRTLPSATNANPHTHMAQPTADRAESLRHINTVEHSQQHLSDQEREELGTPCHDYDSADDSGSWGHPIQNRAQAAEDHLQQSNYLLYSQEMKAAIFMESLRLCAGGPRREPSPPSAKEANEAEAEAEAQAQAQAEQTTQEQRDECVKMICPSCASTYSCAHAVCKRDGTPLIAIN